MIVSTDPHALLKQGLQLLGYVYGNHVSNKTWINRFKSHYGSDPAVYSKVLEDLQTTNNAEARVEITKVVLINYFFMAMYYLRCNPSETEQAAMFSVSAKTARKWTWFYITKIQQLKTMKVRIFELFCLLSICTVSYSNTYSLRFNGRSTGVRLLSYRSTGLIVQLKNRGIQSYHLTNHITRTRSIKLL